MLSSQKGRHVLNQSKFSRVLTFLRAFGFIMSYSLEEIAVIITIFVTIFILSLFFGLFWAILLVFTLLWLLYKFGRQNIRKKAIKKTTTTSHDIDSKHDDFVDGKTYERGMDVPFTGFSSPKIPSIRSPMPLLSVVTKRLSFNTR